VNEIYLERLMHENDERVQQLPQEPSQEKLGKSGSMHCLIFLNPFHPKFKGALHYEFERFCGCWITGFADAVSRVLLLHAQVPNLQCRLDGRKTGS
jgi:hypothetical protein